MKKQELNRSRMLRNILILGNILLILVAITFVLYYATDVRRDREDMERDTFTSTVETMKQISVRYLDTERQWCCTIKVDIENSKSQYIEKDKQEATKDGSESTKI